MLSVNARIVVLSRRPNGGMKQVAPVVVWFAMRVEFVIDVVATVVVTDAAVRLADASNVEL